jgi:uncharacterized Fe-S cluster protein YjdI
MKDLTKKYKNGELTIVWQPGKCIHAAECVKALPQVYNPKARPWIQAENATIEELKAQIQKCPSGALSYHMEGEGNKEVESLKVAVEVMENGPLLVYGTLEVMNENGNIETKNKTTAFCRCGASNNKPYCDGAHMKIEFKG